MPNHRDRWSSYHFSQATRLGKAQGDVAALLRRVADSLDALGDAHVDDVILASEANCAEDDLTTTAH